MVVADDHELMLSSIRLLLEDEQGVEVVGAARSLDAAVESATRLRPDVLVLGVPLRDGSRTGAIEALAGRVGASRIVLASMQSDPALAERALSAGAVGYVRKDRADLELPQAVRAAYAGRTFVSPTMQESVSRRGHRFSAVS